MSTVNMLIAGFGGQGVLFAGKFIAYKGLLEGRELSWLPSYGPEMRGGTANCSVILSDIPVGSPIVSKPDAKHCCLSGVHSNLAPLCRNCVIGAAKVENLSTNRR